jgi:sigma-E factor negative regulatory protein RseA
MSAIQEQLSAFLDGELSAAESELLLKRIERDPQLKATLERYVLAGEALRATQVQPRPSRDFSAKVGASIARESVPARARAIAMQWLKPVAGGAIAAGVAALVLVNLQGPQGPAPQPVPQVAQDTVLPAPVVQVVADTVANDPSYVVPPAVPQADPLLQVPLDGRLANFVIAHSEYSSPLGRSNVLTGLLTDEPLPQQAASPTEDARATEQR